MTSALYYYYMISNVRVSTGSFILRIDLYNTTYLPFNLKLHLLIGAFQLAPDALFFLKFAFTLRFFFRKSI